MQKKSAIIGTVAITLLPVLATWYISRSAPDVRYTLLERIPVSAGSAQSPVETVQQLQVRNSGSAKAERIIVRVNEPVKLDNVSKYAESDQIKVVSTERSFQLEYPELPPDGRFSLVLRSLGSGINTGNLDISHSAGKATEALAGRQESKFEVLVLGGQIFFALLYALFAIRGLWKLVLEQLESGLKFAAPTEVLGKKTP